MGGYVRSVPACYVSSLGSNPDISQKYKMGEISKEGPTTLARQNKYTKEGSFLTKILDVF
jgi:hypothetical protein